MIRMDGLRPECWPDADRQAWEAANTQSDDPWAPDGEALKLRPETRRGYAGAYGIYLAYLGSTGQLLQHETPGARATPPRIHAWIGHMRALDRANGTMKLYLMSLHAILAIIAPGVDTNFILHPGGQTLDQLFPTDAKPSVPQDTRDLLGHVRGLHQRGMAEQKQLQRSKLLRDAAIMAVLYSRAPRVSNLAAMRIGEHLLMRPDGTVHIHFSGAITKSHRDLDYPLDPDCAGIVSDYLKHGRPHMRGADETTLVWMGTNGRPLNTVGVTGVVMRRNRDFIARAEGPHMARKWLTDTARSRSPEAAFDAAEVLGHSPQTALRHYAQGVELHAGRRLGETIARLREQTEGIAMRAFAERE